MSVITGQIPAALDTAAADRRTAPAAGGSPYAALGNANALAQWEYCFDRGDTDTSRGAAQQLGLLGSGQPNAADPSWNATAQKLIPAGGAGTGTTGHAKTRGRRSSGWPQFHPDEQLLRARPPRARRAVQPGRQQRLQRRAPARLQQRRAATSRSASRRSPATARRTTAASTRSARNNIGGVHDRQRRRHDLRRHRRLRRAGRRRVGRAAGRGPQLVVLRQLRLAQPRQLRSRRPPLDAGLLPRRVPAQLHAGAQRRRQAAAADASSTACAPATTSRPAARSSIASAFVACVGTAGDGAVVAARSAVERARSTRRDSTSAGCATMGEKLDVPRGLGHRRRRSRCVTRRARTSRRTRSRTRRWRRSASTSRSTCRCSTTST